MKQLLSCLLASALVMSMSACASTSNTSTAETAAEPTVEAQAEQKPEKQATETAETPAQEVTFEAFTPIDNEECTITIKELVPDSTWGYTVKTELENKSTEKTYMFSVSTAAIDGIQVDPFFATEIAPGKKSNSDISFSSDVLKENGVTNPTDIELSFRVYDTNDWNAPSVAEETIHVYPYGEDKATVFSREQQSSDQVLVDNDNVTVLITDKVKDSIWGYTLKLYILNKTDTSIMVAVDEASVNGYMADPFFAKSVMPGKCAFTSVSWSDTTLQENGITDIESIEFKLRVYDDANWSGSDFVNEVITVTP